MQIFFVETDWSFQGIFKTEKVGDTCEKGWRDNVKCGNARSMAA